MRSRSLWSILLLLTAMALAGWWARDVPALRGWLPEALRRLPVATPEAGPTGGTATAARKCLGAAQVVYTDGPCPPGTREAAMTGGSVSVLPALRPPAAATATATAPAGSAPAPLRRLAGPYDSAAQRERVLEQALHR